MQIHPALQERARRLCGALLLAAGYYASRIGVPSELLGPRDRAGLASSEVSATRLLSKLGP